MAKKKGYVRPYIRGSWVPVEDDMILSGAFRDLQPSAAILLLHLLRVDKTLAWKKGNTYNGLLQLTFSEAETLGFARGTTLRGFRELATRGFIEVIEKGGLRSQGRTSSVYRISERWRTSCGLQSLKELNILKKCGKST